MKIQITDIPNKTNSPILTYCRQLIKQGVHPRTSLKVYKGDILAIKIKTIRLGAKYTIKEDINTGPRFVLYTPYTGPLVHQGEEKTTCPLP